MVIQFGPLNQNQFAGQSVGKKCVRYIQFATRYRQRRKKCLHSWRRKLGDNLEIVVNLLEELFSK